QLAPAARVIPHLLPPVGLTKSVPVPVLFTATVSMEIAVPPGLVTMKVVAGLVSPTATFPKSFDAGVMVSWPPMTPVPLNAALTMPPGVADTLRVPLFGPTEPGLNVTAIVHEPLAGSACMHLLSTTKSEGNELT